MFYCQLFPGRQRSVASSPLLTESPRRARASPRSSARQDHTPLSSRSSCSPNPELCLAPSSPGLLLLLSFLLSSSSSPALAPLLLPLLPSAAEAGVCVPEPARRRQPLPEAPAPALLAGPRPRLLLPPAPRSRPVCLPVRWRPSLTDSCPCSEYNLPNSLFFRYLQICATVSNFSSTKRPFQLLPN